MSDFFDRQSTRVCRFIWVFLKCIIYERIEIKKEENEIVVTYRSWGEMLEGIDEKIFWLKSLGNIIDSEPL